MNFGAFAGGMAQGISRGIRDKAMMDDAEWKKNDAEWKKKERDRLEADQKLDDEINKQSRDYMNNVLAIMPESDKEAQGASQATPTAPTPPAVKSPAASAAANGIFWKPDNTASRQEQPAAATRPLSPVASGISSVIRQAKQPQEGVISPANDAHDAKPKYRKPTVDDMVDIAQFRAQQYLNAGRYDKASAVHKDYLVFAAQKIQDEERDRTEEARKVAGNVMLGDFSGAEAFYNTRIPDGNKLGGIVENPDGTITAHAIDRNGKALPPATFQDRNQLAGMIASLSNSQTLLKHLENSAKQKADAGKANADQAYKNRDLDIKEADVKNKAQHNRAMQDIYRNKPQLTTSQQRINQEIQAARNAIILMSPEVIKKRTQQYSATGRENPQYDPLLAAKVRQANRRKFGEDDGFPLSQHGGADAGDDAGDGSGIPEKFSADPAMRGMRLGKPTDLGHEVFDANGKLIGHYN